jgi:hypothetical protein
VSELGQKLARIRDHLHDDFAMPTRENVVYSSDYWAWRTGIAEGCVLYLLTLIPLANLPEPQPRR